jgi:hypothetical protein
MPLPASMPPGAWWLPYRVRRYLTYRSQRRRLVKARDGWGVSGHKAGQIIAEARAAADDIMGRH